ncbi:MAG: exonuclease subunit SbcD [Roseivirga sp.]|nr:exonuclease subunit SbcD [Roseivirga sp.]
MKILHTADWHIGKILHKHPLQDQLKMFFDWLYKVIEQESIDLLLVSGDVFDLANPSAKDRELYYSFLTRLSGLKLQVIITGGNHDSVGFLNAPKDLLNELNITVIGGATEALEDELVEVGDQNDKPELIVAAVPFLRDKDLRNRETDEQYENRTEAIREGIKKHYADLAEVYQTQYPDTPALAMGHLYTIGADPSDSERDIHIGNAAAVDASAFPEAFGYVALGHIHRPQVIGKNEYIRYSGSPIALSFSEKNDHKCVLIVNLENGQLNSPQVLPVPAFRELKKFTGTLTEVRQKLDAYQPEFALQSFVEIEVQEEVFSSVMISEVEDLKTEYAHNERFTILKSKTTFRSGAKDTADLFHEGENIEDLTPTEVFAKRVESEELDSQTESLLKEAYQELLESVQQEGEL